MHFFKYEGSELYCEGTPVEKIAEKVGTPFYLYSYNTLLHHYKVFDKAFRAIPHLVCFAVKANSNLAVLSLFAREGAGADVVSGGEIYRALKAGIPPQKIVYAGVGKTEEEIEYALNNDILMFNVESDQELRLINAVAGRLKKRARVALRVNPDVDPQTHPYISTGLKKNKFGIDISMAVEEYQAAQNLKSIEVAGVHKHIGSQIIQVQPFVDSLIKISELVKNLRELKIDIRYLDVGGGLGITYKGEDPPTPKVYAESLIAVVKDLGSTIILEPGRVIVGNAGILVTKVLYYKKTPRKNFVVVDAGMNDLARPSLYGSYHSLWPVNKGKDSRKTVTADVVGPICESADFLAQEREMPEMKPGELLAVMSAGAYGFSMSSNYNSRRRPAEVLVNEDKYEIIRERESNEDLVRGERVPNFLK